MRILKFFSKEKEIKYRYSLRDGNLFVENTQTGKPVWEGKPENKIIESVLPLYGTDDCIVHFTIHKGYENISKIRNICRCNAYGEIIWMAQLPDTIGDDYFLSVGWADGELWARTWSTYFVIFYKRSGIIKKKVLTK